jgi:hypothetical protein
MEYCLGVPSLFFRIYSRSDRLNVYMYDTPDDQCRNRPPVLVLVTSDGGRI